MSYIHFVLFLPFIVGCCFAYNYHIYVSPNGSDLNNGTSTHFPLKGVRKALSNIPGLSHNKSDILSNLLQRPNHCFPMERPQAEINNSVSTKLAVYIELMAGYHELERTIRIGTYSPKVVIRSYQHQPVNMIGGKQISGSAFKRVTDGNILTALTATARSHVRVVHLPDVNITNYGDITPYGYGFGRVNPLEVFYNGKKLRLARWPDEGYTNIVNVPDGRYSVRFQYNSSVPNTWHNVDEPWVYGFWHESWADVSVKVANLNTATSMVTLANKTHFGLRTGHYNEPGADSDKQGGFFRFENILSALDTPGEYYLDRKTGNLYVWLPSSDGNAKSSDKIYVSLINNCLEIHRNVQTNVVLSDFTLEACRYVGIRGTRNRNVQITNMEIRNTGYYAIGMYQDCRDVHVTNCLIHDVDGGINLEGGNRATLESSGIVIENNEIYNYTNEGASGRRGIYLKGVGHIVRYNTIYNGRTEAIAYLTVNDAVIEWNHVHHVCTGTAGCMGVRTGGDWSTRGNKFRYNIIHDVTRLVPGSENRGLSLDDHHSSTEITNNVFFNNMIHVSIGGGRNNVLSNNVLYNAAKESVRIEDGRTNDGHFKVLTNRLHSVPYNSSLWTSRYPDLVSFDSINKTLPEGNQITKNIVYNAGNKPFIFHAGRPQYWHFYNISDTGYSMGPSDHIDVRKGDLRVTCHAGTWANQVNFVQVPAPNEVGPRKSVGPIHLHRAAYNPLSRGNSHACTTHAPARTTPMGSYLPDGSGDNNVFTIPKKEGCWLRVDACSDDEYAVGLDRDSWGEEHLHSADNETACFQRAVDQWKACGAHKNEQVVAIFGPTGASTLAGDGCYLASYGCPKHGGPADGHANITTGKFTRDHNAPDNEEACHKRAHDVYVYCGSFINYPVTAIYRPTGATQTAGRGCWIHVLKCPKHANTKTMFYDAWGATNLQTDVNEEACLDQAWYYWTRCGSDPSYPVTATFRPTIASRTVPV